MEIVTLCGSLKFKDELMKMAVDLELEGKCVLNIIYPTSDDKDAYTDEEMELLKKAHLKRIEMSDAIFVCNVGGYIGDSTKKEIEYAKSLGKNVYYLESV